MRRIEDPACLMTHAEQPSTRSIKGSWKTHVDQWKPYPVLHYVGQRQVAFYSSCAANLTVTRVSYVLTEYVHACMQIKCTYGGVLAAHQSCQHIVSTTSHMLMATIWCSAHPFTSTLHESALFCSFLHMPWRQAPLSSRPSLTQMLAAPAT